MPNVADDRHVIQLTKLELRGLIRAASKVMDHPDVKQEFFLEDRPLRLAATRAYNKLLRCLYK